jgi:hypothetical protein
VSASTFTNCNRNFNKRCGSGRSGAIGDMMLITGV